VANAGDSALTTYRPVKRLRYGNSPHCPVVAAPPSRWIVALGTGRPSGSTSVPEIVAAAAAEASAIIEIHSRIAHAPVKRLQVSFR
jgi:hypothetical protein